MTITRRFIADRSGNFAMLMALMTIPVIGGLGRVLVRANLWIF